MVVAPAPVVVAPWRVLQYRGDMVIQNMEVGRRGLVDATVQLLGVRPADLAAYMDTMSSKRRKMQ